MMKRTARAEANKQNEVTILRQPLALSRQEVAQALGLSLRAVDKLIADGDIQVKRYGRRVLVPTVEVERFLES
jgi:excisionase family DNA binding protein